MPHSARRLHVSLSEMPHINTTTRILAVAVLLPFATLLSVPLSLLLAALCFGLRRRDPWVIAEPLASTQQV